MTNEGNGIGKGLLIGVFVGAAVGSIIALLYAPKSGKKLREDIKTKSEDFTQDARKYISNVEKKASHLINDVKKKSELLVSDTEEKVDALVDESQKVLIDAKGKVGNSVYIGKGKIKKERERFKSALRAGMKVYKFEKKD